jgi:hypothetical protein
MPIERAPARPLPQNYQPPGGVPYRVGDNETWGSIAAKAGIDVFALIEFNFQTRNPAEVNWYLRRNVGCVLATMDGQNWRFSTRAQPGIIYLPPAAIAPAASSGIWFGIGIKGGGHFFAIGKDTIEAWLVSYDNYDDSFFMNVDGWRLGPGLGGSVGGVLVIVTSLTKPQQLNGHMFGGADFEASLGGRWSSVAKAVDKLQPAMKVLKGAKRVTKGAIKAAEWEKTRDSIKAAASALGMKFDAAEPEVNAISIPGAGIGAEISLFYGWGEVLVHGVSEGSKLAEP